MNELGELVVWTNDSKAMYERHEASRGEPVGYVAESDNSDDSNGSVYKSEEMEGVVTDNDIKLMWTDGSLGEDEDDGDNDGDDEDGDVLYDPDPPYICAVCKQFIRPDVEMVIDNSEEAVFHKGCYEAKR